MDNVAGRGRKRGSLRKSARDRVIFEGARRAEAQDGCLICCVDDTDDVSGDVSTGYISELIAAAVADAGGCVSLGITRHQLLLDSAIPYTSHNSAMCFMAYMAPDLVAPLREAAIDILEERSASASDPGLCFAYIDPAQRASPSDSLLDQIDRLIAFGRKAQSAVVDKGEAYRLAGSVPWLRLSEHGGSGQGVIGALAGAGLRLGGEDGRFRGRWDMGGILGVEEGAISVSDFRQRLSDMVAGEVCILDRNGTPLSEHTMVSLEAQSKPILHRGKLTFVADRQGDTAVPLSWAASEPAPLREASRMLCDSFCIDNDREECAEQLSRSCRNCLHRRWTPQGFGCMLS